jgi:hypothetical protein
MRNNRMRPSTLGLLASTVLFGSALSAQSAKDVIAEHDKAYQAWMTTYRSASKEARQKIISERPLPEKIFPRMTAIIDADPKSSDALIAANWMITRGRVQGDQLNHSLTVMVKHHTQSAELAGTCTALGRTPTKASMEFLSTIEKQSPHSAVQAQACLSLAEVHKRQAGIAQQIKAADKDKMATLITRYGRETVDILKAASPAALEKRAEQHFQKVMETPAYAKISYGRNSTLGARAKSNLFELRNLSIGKTAPEIAGEDIDGNPMKLTDYRGKVVVLDFWGDW